MPRLPALLAVAAMPLVVAKTQLDTRGSGMPTLPRTLADVPLQRLATGR